MALKGEIVHDGYRWVVVETRTFAANESLSVEVFVDKNGKIDPDCIILNFVTLKYVFWERLKEAFKGRTQRDVVLNKEEFFDFVDKLNEIAEIVRKADEERG